MNPTMAEDIEAWEDEGGATLSPLGVRAISMNANQVEWAERIKRQVNEESIAWRGHSARSPVNRVMPRALIPKRLSILEEKRAEVMRREQAGCFIHDWQEISDQVRQMIFNDVRYQAIKTNRLQSKWR